MSCSVLSFEFFLIFDFDNVIFSSQVERNKATGLKLEEEREKRKEKLLKLTTEREESEKQLRWEMEIRLEQERKERLEEGRMLMHMVETVQVSFSNS